jgi:octaprenyl-diphosphate synthase
VQKVASVNLAAIQRPVSQDLDRVLVELRRIIAADFPIIADVNRHLLRMRGKVFRPTLVLLSASATDDVTPRDVRLAAVVELIHVATLVHDDSVDHSVLRRGQPTVNALFSHQVAVIMGDYLYSRAIIELVDLDDPEPLRVMSRVTNEMTVGEMRELVAHDMLDYSESDYDELIRSKTASLMSAACEIGGLRGRPADREALRRYGLFLGMAFQITDDVLDYTGTESVTGKPSGHDLREHKITLPLIAALPRLLPAERRQVQQLMADSAPSDDLIHAVIAAVASRGGVAAAQERALKLAQRAEAELDRLPESAAREALRDCLSYAVERRS